MGSFQQITLGIVCLAAAFLFGNYVNNHPDPGNVKNAIAEANPELHPESNASILEPGISFQRPAPMDVMRGKTDSAQPTLKPRDAGEIAGSGKPGAGGIALPPPSQLDGNVAETQPTTIAAPIPNLVDSSSRREILIPDFSELAAQFRNTPLELPPLNGSNPISIRIPNSTAGQSPWTGPGNAPPQPRELLSDKTAIDDVSRDVSRDMSRDVSRDSQVQPIASDFAADDFEPGLERKFGLESPSHEKVGPEAAPDNDAPFAAATDPKPDNFVRSMNEPSILENSAEQTATLVQIQNNPNTFAKLQSRGEMGVDTGVQPPQPAPARLPQNLGKPMIPFGLTDRAKNNLVRLKNQEQAEMTLGTKRFDQYTTRPGDSLQSLSTKFYGRPDFYLDIYIANKQQLRNPATIPTGVTLRIPMYD